VLFHGARLKRFNSTWRIASETVRDAGKKGNTMQFERIGLIALSYELRLHRLIFGFMNCPYHP
jgi:hypothetical protein